MFGEAEDHAEMRDLHFVSCVQLFNLLFKEFVELHLGLIWCVDTWVKIGYKSYFCCIPSIFIPWMFVKVLTAVVSQDLVDFRDLLDAGNGG
jgi:hypothetical protein